jgi:hypothetical protein
LVETLQEQRELLHDVFAEVLEDFALAEAIREGQKTKPATRAGSPQSPYLSDLASSLSPSSSKGVTRLRKFMEEAGNRSLHVNSGFGHAGMIPHSAWPERCMEAGRWTGLPSDV